jgi:hypothetical protein
VSKVKERQTSFAGGEFSPGLRGRTDLSKYAIGCKTADNFFVNPSGNLMNRAGTTFCNVYTNGMASYQTMRLVPFELLDGTTALMVIMGHTAHSNIQFRLYSETASSLADMTLLGSVNTINWLHHDHLSGLRFAQMGSVMTVTHPDLLPFELYAEGDTGAWTFGVEIIDFSVPDFDSSQCGVPLVSAWTQEEPADGAHPKREWTWQITQIVEEQDGRVYETMPETIDHTGKLNVRNFYEPVVLDPTGQWYVGGGFGVGDVVYMGNDVEHLGYWYKCLIAQGTGTGTSLHHPTVGGGAYWEQVGASSLAGYSDYERFYTIVLYSSNPVIVSWERLAMRPPTLDRKIRAYRVYRGRAGRYGFLGETTDLKFLDEGAEPDYAFPPPQGTNPFQVTDSDGVVVRTEHPRVCGFFEGRRLFASTEQRPGLVVGSEIDNYYNFDEIIPPLDSSSYYLELASSKIENIRALVPRQQLLVLTDSSEWMADGGGAGAVMTPTSLVARVLSEHGCGDLAPLTFGDCVLFAQRKGTIPRLMLASPEGGRMKAIDISGMSKHFFDGHTIVDWCYAEDPYKQIWAVRDDGKLLSCCFDPDQDTVAWAIHEVSDGEVTAICAIPEGTEDTVYLAVKRTLGGNEQVCLERMATRQISSLDGAVFLDSAVTWNLTNTDAGKSITVAKTGSTSGPGDEVTIHATGISLTSAPGVRVYDADDEIFADIDIESTSGDHWVGRLRQDLPDGVNGVATTHFRLKTTGFPSLTHLRGQEVYALLDGNVEGPYTVPNTGYLTMGQSYTRGSVGLLYESDFAALPVSGDRTRKKIVESITIEYESARGGKAGTDFDNLKDMPGRSVSDNYAELALATAQHRILVPAAYSETGEVVVRQSDPLPMTILGITREVELGG